jgi:acyl dehydratase
MTSTTTAAEFEVGASVPIFVRTGGFQAWNRYAAVNDEFVDIHMDDDAGRDAGYPGAFGMGNLQWSYLHNLLRAWMGDDGRIVRLGCQFRGPMLKGSVVRARGVITAVRTEGSETLVDLDLWTEDGAGHRMVPARATVALPAT